VAHIEAWLRSWDLSMPEEINRMATDSICDYFFTTEPSWKKYLLQWWISESKIFEVGNLMIDSLMYQIEKNKQSPSALIWDIITKYPKYIACTFHRPHNVDTAEAFWLLVDQLNKVAEEQTLVFPIHPRTRSRLQQFGLILSDNIVVLNPLWYAEFVQLVSWAACILTDSGGIQEETTYLGIPCLTVRPNTERPVTIEQGTNELIEVNNIYQKVWEVLDNSKKDVIIEMRDWWAAERIISHIKKIVL
jgi:UDP-N-acetylglucosamine 2-epimerase (non-hydrolysing)